MQRNRTVRVTTAILSVVAFVSFAAAAIGVWFVAAALKVRADRLLDEAEHALDRAQPVLQTVREAVNVAEKEIKAAQPAAPKEALGLSKKLLRSALKETPDRVATASRAVAALNDLLIVAQAGLDATQDHRSLPPELDDGIPALRTHLASSAAALKNVEAILGSTKDSQSIAAEETSKIEQALSQTSGIVELVDTKMTSVRSQVTQLRELIASRLRYGTWIILSLSLMGALGQVALFRACTRHCG